MKVIIFDTQQLFNWDFQKVFEERNIDVIHFNNSDESIKAFIKNPDIDFFIFFIRGTDLSFYYSTATKLKKINPILNIFCVYDNKGTFEDVEGELAKQRVKAVSVTEGPENIALKLLSADVDNKEQYKRTEHRVNCDLRANLYKHNEFDQKISETRKDVTLVSFSANGAYISNEKFLPEEMQTYLLEIILPDAIYIIKGLVVWVNKDNSVFGRPIGFALKFNEIAMAPQSVLKHLVEEDLINKVLTEYSTVGD